MASQTGGMGAEVNVRKIDSEEDMREAGEASNSRIAYAIFSMMMLLSVFGIWKILELVWILF